MHVPAWFKEESVPKLHALMRAYAFATIVTHVDGEPFATHLPFLLNEAAGELGTLRGHMARANPQWKGFEENQQALVIFQGPHAYISPSWYEVQPSVPTWNYAVVHAYGRPGVVDDIALRDILVDSTKTFDDRTDVAALPDDYFSKMVNGVVGFEIHITRLEGKLKLSQNRSREDRDRVVQALRASANSLDHDLADWMLASGENH